MLDILAITGPIYLVILAGYLATRAELFQKSDMRVLGKFVMNFALPALLFNALAKRPLREVLHVDYLLVYAVAALIMLVLGYAWARWVTKCEEGFWAYFAMGVSSSNSGYVGYPVALMLVGSSAAVALALNMLVENLLILPLLFAMADRKEKHDAHWFHAAMSTMDQLVRNPMIVAILVGFVCSLSGWHFPVAVERTITLFANATSGIALFVIGGTLVGLEIKGAGPVMAQLTVGKLLVHPLVIVALVYGLIPIADPSLRTAAITFAAMPMLGIYSLLASRHGFEELAAATLLVCTLASFVTLNMLLWFLHR